MNSNSQVEVPVARQKKSRVVALCGIAQNDVTSPAEISKTWRLTEIAQQLAQHAGIEVDGLNLSLVTSDSRPT